MKCKKRRNLSSARKNKEKFGNYIYTQPYVYHNAFQKGFQVFGEDLAELVISLHICDSNKIRTHNHLVHK